MTTSSANLPIRAFLCHSSGDKAAVRALYRRLRDEGIEPWLDEEEMLPGQDWEHEIAKAVRSADVVIVCLSNESVTKTGYVQKEIRVALDVADQQPHGVNFIIPLKLEECGIPARLRRWHWVNYFEAQGYERLLRALQRRRKRPNVPAKFSHDSGPAAAESRSSIGVEMAGASVRPAGTTTRITEAADEGTSHTDTHSHGMINFFISYNQTDKAWAEWIAWELEEDGHTTILQAWDFRPSDDFVLKMDWASRKSERLIAVLSPDYLNAAFAQAEWAAAFLKDPSGEKGKLLPVCVRKCDVTGLLAQRIRIDLVGRDENEARKELLNGIQRGRTKPLTKPGFPGGTLSPRSVSEHPLFPGKSVRKIRIKLLMVLAMVPILAIGLIYIRRSPFFSPPPETPIPCQKRTLAIHYYEAEFAELAGGASEDKEHPGFSGDSFVSGYGGAVGASSTFSVETPVDGQYKVDLCYANGTTAAKTLTIYVNGEPLKQTRLPNAPRWNFWLTGTEFLPLKAGRNTISYIKGPSDSGQVNLDFIGIAREPTSRWPQPTPIPGPTQIGTVAPTGPRQSNTRRQTTSQPKRIPCTAERKLFGEC